MTYAKSNPILLRVVILWKKKNKKFQLPTRVIYRQYERLLTNRSVAKVITKRMAKCHNTCQICILFFF